MPKDINAQEYFLSRRLDSGSVRQTYTRIARAMYMHDSVTMNRLCEMSDKDLEKVRGIGDKARAIIIEECERYLETEEGESGCDDEE